MSGYTESTSGIASNGFQNTYSGGFFDAFLVKFDANGNRLWATYYGGTNTDHGKNVATDALGNVYLSGYTESTSGIASNGFQNTYGGMFDAFLVKFDANGNRLWATYYGGTGDEEGLSIATDVSRNVYLGGYTSSLSVIASGGFQNTYGGSYDAFLVKFDANGNRLWATYYGGTDVEWEINGMSVTTDALENVYMAGQTSSNSNIASAGSFQNTYNGNRDAFLVKFNDAGNRLWGTYYGGISDDYGKSIATDIFGNVYLGGYTSSISVIASGGFQNTYGGNYDAFLVKFDAAGNRLCATYYGGTNPDDGTSIAIASGNIYLAGITNSPSGIASGGFQNTYGGTWSDAYLAKFCSCESTVNITSTSTNLVCNGQCTGTSTVTVTSACGISPYTYSWNTIPVQTTQIATGLCAGTYTVTVTNAIAFTATATVTISQPIALTTTVTSTGTTCGNNNGTATVTANGGTNYTYLWDPSGQTSQNATELEAGEYTIIVTDANGCIASNTVKVASSQSVTASAGLDNTICIGQTITLIASGGENYLWNNGATTSSIVVTPSVTSTYSVIAFIGVCSDAASVNVTVLPPPSAYISVTAICAGQIATLTAEGGGNYNWSTGETTESISVSPTTTTTYSVIVSIGSCWDTASSEVTVYPSPSVSVSGNTMLCTGDITTLTASGDGNYLWSNGATTSSIIVTPSATSTYSVIAFIDVCSDTASVNVTVSPPPSAYISLTAICAGQIATLTAEGGGNYNWSTGETTESISVSPTTTTTYSVIVSIGSCSDTASSEVTVSPSPSVSVSGNTMLCTGDITTLTASGGEYYLWNNGATTSSIIVTPSATSTYSVVASIGVCRDTASVNVTVSSTPIASATSTTICAGQIATLIASGGGNYNWSTGETTESISISPTTTTTYSVVVSIGSCLDTTTASIIVNSNPTANAWSNTTITAGNSTMLSASGGTSYIWSNGVNDSVITVSPPITTNYCVTVSNGNCTDTACVTVFVEPLDCSTTGKLYLPNAFSPNGDGENDVLKIYFGNLQCIKTFHLVIYNRLGEKIFETTNPMAEWNGYYKNMLENTAVFVYYLKATLITEEKITKKGNVSLI
ncbi:MAG: SBBP repeat-containing protein, partial [Bacteroidota bacterium]